MHVPPKLVVGAKLFYRYPCPATIHQIHNVHKDFRQCLVKVFLVSFLRSQHSHSLVANTNKRRRKLFTDLPTLSNAPHVLRDPQFSTQALPILQLGRICPVMSAEFQAKTFCLHFPVFFRTGFPLHVLGQAGKFGSGGCRRIGCEGLEGGEE